VRRGLGPIFPNISDIYAAGSLYETVTQAIIARNQGFLNPADYQKLYAAAEEVSRMLSGLRGSLDT
jgi:four helix bundle protein